MTTRSAAERRLAKGLLRVLRHGGDVRGQKVQRLRAKVRAQGYENELKLTIAVERLMRSMARLVCLTS